MPQPIADGNNLEIEFYAGRDDITYTVWICTNLALGNWTENEVTVSEPDQEGRCTARVPIDATKRLMKVEMTR